MSRKPIVTGADGSERSALAVRWAAAEADRHELPLRIVSVAPLSTEMEWFVTSGTGETQARGLAVRALRDAADAVTLTDPLLTVDTCLRIGDAGPTLARLDQDASMIVIGGRGPASAAPLHDSVARYVAGHARCPVVVCCGDTGRASRQVMVGLHDLSSCGPALAFAFEEAARRGARLLAVHAWYWAPVLGGDSAAFTPARVSADALTRLHHLLEPWRWKYPAVETGAEIRHEHPGRALAGLSASADLLVLGRHRRGLTGPPAPPGSIIPSLLSHSQAPVAIIPGITETAPQPG